MKDNNLPPLSRTPHRRQFFPVIDLFQEEATGEVPSISVGNAQTNNPRQENHDLASKETMPVPLVKPPSLLPRQTPAIRSDHLAPPVQSEQAREAVKAADRNRNRVWRPGTFGFDNSEEDGDSLLTVTIPMLVLKNISDQQGQPSPTM